jgi:HSP20 family protein
LKGSNHCTAKLIRPSSGKGRNFRRCFGRHSYRAAPREYPLINLYDDQDSVYVEALAPGADPSSFNISVAGDTLTLSGEKRRAASEVKPEAFHREERAAGKFIRTIELPAEVDDGKVKGEYKDGLLLVTLPKAAKAKPRQIPVQIA